MLFLLLIWFFMSRSPYFTFDHPGKWKRLSPKFLKPAADLICKLFPLHIEWLGRKPAKGEKILFVCNHGLWGIEIPVLMAVIYMQTGLYPRGILDHFHLMVPIWGNCLKFMGGIGGTRTEVQQTMELEEPLLVFPGGGEEVARNSNTPRYTMRWGERKGFAKLALDNGYTIVTVSNIGVEELMEVVYDFPIVWLGKLIGMEKRAEKFKTLPIVRPSFNWPKAYIQFGAPLDTTNFTEGTTDEKVTEIRDQCRDSISNGIESLKQRQSVDPDRYRFKLTWLIGQN